MLAGFLLVPKNINTSHFSLVAVATISILNNFYLSHILLAEVFPSLIECSYNWNSKCLLVNSASWGEWLVSQICECWLASDIKFANAGSIWGWRLFSDSLSTINESGRMLNRTTARHKSLILPLDISFICIGWDNILRFNMMLNYTLCIIFGGGNMSCLEGRRKL